MRAYLELLGHLFFEYYHFSILTFFKCPVLLAQVIVSLLVPGLGLLLVPGLPE